MTIKSEIATMEENMRKKGLVPEIGTFAKLRPDYANSKRFDPKKIWEIIDVKLVHLSSPDYSGRYDNSVGCQIQLEGLLLPDYVGLTEEFDWTNSAMFDIRKTREEFSSLT